MMNRRHPVRTSGHRLLSRALPMAVAFAVTAGSPSPAQTPSPFTEEALARGRGLALVSETPVTVVNVMRGGPSTGIPTKSEQSDLNIALYGLHGDAPHLVLAPLSIRDCVFTTQWAVQLAEHLQTVAIVLSDQSLGQSQAIIEAPSTTLVLPPERRVRMDEWSLLWLS